MSSPQSIRERVKHLEKVDGRTPEEAASYLAQAARLREEHPDAFAAPPAPPPPSGPFLGSSKAKRRPLGGVLSKELMLGDTYITTYRWVLAIGLCVEWGCVLCRLGDDVHVFGSKDAVTVVLLRQAEILPEMEAEARAAEAQIKTGTPAEHVAYFGASYRRAYVAGRIAERKSSMPTTRRRERAKTAAGARERAEKAGWVCLDRPPVDLWVPPNEERA